MSGTFRQALSSIGTASGSSSRAFITQGPRSKHYWEEADQYMIEGSSSLTKLAGDMTVRGELFTGGETAPLTDSGSYSVVTGRRL
ncbi:MAG: hypothetical protein ACREDR_48585 [Blastocatellia bacterium]